MFCTLRYQYIDRPENKNIQMREKVLIIVIISLCTSRLTSRHHFQNNNANFYNK